MIDLIQYRALAEKLFADIRAFSFDGVGITRESYGRGESAAADYLRDLAQSEGLDVQGDRAANLIFRFPDTPPDRPVVWLGSHMDSVPQGGNYDGLAGVAAGLLCLIARQREGRGGNVEVIGFRGEESAWFGKAYMGSSALLGKLSEADLALTRRGTDESLGDCMQALGADMAAIRAGDRLFDPARIRTYLELHIEQGPVMVARQLPVAVVSSIRGNFRHNRVLCEGESGHSGAVPRWLRHDAMFAVSDLIMRLDEHWRLLLERGTDLVVTAGIVGTDPAEHAVSRIPGRVAFSLEARSRSTDTLEAFYQVLQAECSAVSHERGVKFEFDRRVLSAPATMDPRVCDTLSAACAARGLAFDVIPSGAGHDAALMANAGIPSGMVFVRNEHGSHNPREAMDLDDFMTGVQVLSDALEPLSA
ncbi:MAG: hydantoinase/carbamoylase family amidase [Castellaniella sp.]|nr:hydantoinase/carbamoylase family amidase [Castellaniella sp.]